MKLSLTFSLAFTFLFLFSQHSIFAQVPTSELAILSLTLSNGDQVSGTFVSADKEVIIIENKYAGKFPIRLTEIKNWKTSQEALRMKLTEILPSLSNVTTPPPAAKNEVTTVAALAAKATQKPEKKSDTWKRQVNLAYTMTRGNIKSSDLNAAFQLSRKRGTRKTALHTFMRQGVNNGRQAANLLTSTFRYERTLLRLPMFNETQFEIDKLKKLEYRLSNNVGFNLPIIKGDSRRMSIDLGTGLTKESYENGIEKLNATSLLRLSATQKLAARTVLQQQATFFSDLIDPGAFRFQAEASMTTPITKHLALRLSGINRYDARPQGIVKPNDFTLLTGFTFDF